MVIYGNRLFGKVDQVPGLGYVATRFFHIDYLPLIPYEGWLVLKHEGKTWRGVKIPVSPKSLLIAWGRTAGVIAGIVFAFLAIVKINDNRASGADVAEMVVISLAGWGFFAFSKLHKSVTRASYARACQLGKLAKLSDKGMAAIATAYGQAPLTHGFEPVQTNIQTAIKTKAPLQRKTAPALPIPVETSDFDAIPLEEVPTQEIPVEADDSPLGLAVNEPPRPRTETRRHG